MAELKKIVDLQNDDPYTKAKNMYALLKWTKTNLERAAKKEGLQRDVLDKLRTRLEKVVDDMAIASEDAAFGLMNHKIGGVKLMITLLTKSENKKMERLDEARFLFLQAV